MMNMMHCMLKLNNCYLRILEQNDDVTSASKAISDAGIETLSAYKAMRVNYILATPSQLLYYS